MRRLHEVVVHRIGEDLRRALTALDLPDDLEDRVLAALEASLAATRQALETDDGLALAGLSAREHEVARLKLKGRSNAQIASQLGVTSTTVAKHLVRIYQKTHSDDARDLARTVVDSAMHKNMEGISDRLAAARDALADAAEASRLLETVARHIEDAQRLTSSANEDTARFFAAGGRAEGKDEEHGKDEELETQTWGRP